MTLFDANTSIGAFLDGLAAKQPAPGGGAAAALAGALSAAVGEMVLNYSVDKKGLEQFQTELKPALVKFHNARKVLTELVTEDQAAYAAVVELRKLPKDSAERAEKMPAVILTAVRVPQAILATSIAVLELCDQMVHFVNPHLLSDLAVSGDLAMATARCAVFNVRANLPSVADVETRIEVESSVSDLLQRASGIVKQLGVRIRDRIAIES